LAPVSETETAALLALLAVDPYRSSTLRRLAAEARANPRQVHEYAGALTILLHNLAEWDWPNDGVAPRSLWTRTKWRAYLDEELVDLLLLQLIGLRWGMQFRRVLHVPMTSDTGLFRLRDDSSWQSALARQRLEQVRQLFLPAMPSRERDIEQLGRGESDGYGLGSRNLDQPTALEKLLALINAEIQVHKLAVQGRSLFVIQTDLRDFFPRVPHSLLMSLLSWFNLPPLWLEFFRKYLAVKLRTPNGVELARRGLVLDHLIGSVLAELVMLMMDVHVYRAAGVRVLRVVDDIFLLADAPEKARQAWRAVQIFCDSCGLEINAEKSGSVCIDGETLPELPAASPRWGLLRLQPDGRWLVDEPAFEAMHRQISERAKSAPSVLDMVSHYNDYVGYVQRNLGLCVRLDEQHLERVGRSLARLHQDLFGSGHGVLSEIRRRLGGTDGLPEALFYWPITAGGLGLTHPLLPLSAFESWRSRVADPKPPTSPPVPGSRYPAWVAYYQRWQQRLQLQPPTTTPSLKSLILDFIARGREVVGSRKPIDEESLGVYWQWVVHTYGPSLLERLGTFRFLLTELVPLELILQHRVETTSLSEA
jgi:hypothetical protein